MTSKSELLARQIQHVSLDDYNPVPLIDAMGDMAFQARNLNRAAMIYERMLRDPECTVIVCLAGSLVSAGLKTILVEMVDNCMVDVLVSTGANVVDQDFFEGLGYRHYAGDPRADDEELRKLGIDRIYDTFIDEDELRIWHETIAEIADSLEPLPHPSR